MGATYKCGKVVLSLIAFALLVTFISGTAQGQSAFDAFDPSASRNTEVFVVQPDGKILVGGRFSTILGATRRGIARLNADGTLDTAFDANLNDDGGSVFAMVLQPDGKVVVGGYFQTAGGNSRRHLARLDPVSGAADSFFPNPNASVEILALQADGKILVCGGFQNIGGQARKFIARLDPATGLADSFNPNPQSAFDLNTGIAAMAVQTDGKILIGGYFNTIGGQARNHLARFNPDGSLDAAFNPNPNAAVLEIRLQPDGKILVSGLFEGDNSIGGQTRNKLARLDPATGAADSFYANMTGGDIWTMAIQPDGRIVVGGYFSSMGGATRYNIARLDPVIGLADSFDPNVSIEDPFAPRPAKASEVGAGHAPEASFRPASVSAVAIQPDGKILLGGRFDQLSPNGQPIITRKYIARVETDGLADRTLDLGAVGNFIFASAVQPDGKLLIGGKFTTILGVARNNIARLNTDGTLDTGFNPNADDRLYSIAVGANGRILVSGEFTSIGGQTRNRIARLDPTNGLADSFNPDANNAVQSIVVESDDKILAGGQFTNIGGQTRNRIARLDPTTGVADSFNPNANANLNSIAVQADGKIVVGGQFTNIGGQTRNNIARLDPTTGAADAFNPNANSGLYAVAVDANGRILAGGQFTNIGGQTRNYIARLDPTTGAADSFNPNANDFVESIAVQADGKILAGGQFTGIGGQARNYISRLDPNTGLADGFDPNANALVDSITLQTDGKILAGGFFSTIGGQARNLFARLTNDTAALQNLAVTQSTITWTRGGSSPLFTRVAFEYSNDNVTYSVLGNGTAAGSNWTLTGLNFPQQQNFYVRARGYYRGGYLNGSESISESVCRAYLRPVTLASAVSRKLHGGTPFDINLPLSGNPGVECRSGGASGNYQIVFSFANTLTSVGNASVTSGTGNVSSRMMDADAHNYIVNLTGITDMQTTTVTLTSVNDTAGNSSSSIPVSFSLLLGDTDGNASVTATDVSLTKSKSGQSLDASTFRSDVTVNGSINASDVALVKSKSGTAVLR